MPKLTFRGKGSVDADPGSSILNAAMENGVPLHHTCGGNASCSTCRVVVLSGDLFLSPMDPLEAQVLDSFDLKPPTRLGCQALLTGDGDVEVEIPEWTREPRPNKTPPVP